VQLESVLSPYVRPDAIIDWSDPALPKNLDIRDSPAMRANAEYFERPEWARNYFAGCHRDPEFRCRWQAACGSWDGRIVVDVGCGPGNVFATVGGCPKLLIGIDVSAAALRMARGIGYLPLLSDAHALPFVDGFADLVVLNAALHHCDDMAQVLGEAARLVAPGGCLVTDHDPQLTAWHFKGAARWLWDARLHVYRWTSRGFHGDPEEQAIALASEVHHSPGRGVMPSLYRDVLEPLGFSVEVWPHNHTVGSEAFAGVRGRAALKYRFAQRICGIRPDSPEGALSLLCRARRHH
jgi:SAM-dependent methyltransferase